MWFWWTGALIHFLAFAAPDIQYFFAHQPQIYSEWRHILSNPRYIRMAYWKQCSVFGFGQTSIKSNLSPVKLSRINIVLGVFFYVENGKKYSRRIWKIRRYSRAYYIQMYVDMQMQSTALNILHIIAVSLWPQNNSEHHDRKGRRCECHRAGVCSGSMARLYSSLFRTGGRKL